MSSSPISSFSSERRRLDDLVGPLADVSCAVSVHLGCGRLSVRRLLSLERNTVLRLGQSAGEDLHVIVNGVPIATGEIVIVDESTAIRVTGLVAPVAQQEAA